MDINYNPLVTDYVNNADSKQKELLEQIRALIHKSVPDTRENIKWGFPVFSKNKDFAYLRFAKKHITLGFYHIDKIDDPDQLLEGDGNTLKHIKIKSSADINEELLTKWFKSIIE